MVFCEGSWGGRDWTVEWVRWLPCKLIQVPSPASSLVPPKRYVIPEQKTGVRPEQVWSINHRSFWEDKAKNKAEIRKRKTVNQIISVFSRIPITDAHSGQKQQKLIPNFQESWHWEGGGGREEEWTWWWWHPYGDEMRNPWHSMLQQTNAQSLLQK